MNKAAVKAWVEETVQTRFGGNLSEWARAADDLSVSTLHGIRTKGTADPDTLIRIGRAVGKTPEEMFVLAGWLSGESHDEGQLTPQEWSVIQDLRALRRVDDVVYELVTSPIRPLRERLAPSDEYDARPATP